MNRRTALGAALVTPMLTGCYYPQYFDVVWDEEVELHDGSVIVVNFKFTHERLSRFSKYDRAILRDTTMTFDVGPPYGRISQVFKRMQPVLLNRYEGNWYAVIVPRGAGDDPTISGQDWGPMQNANGQYPLKLMRGEFKTISIVTFPDAIITQNLVRNVPAGETASLSGKRIDLLNEKAMLIRKHVLHHDDRTLRKPQASAPIPTKS